MARYKLNRSGQFTVRTTGPNHCGTSDVLAIKYRLAVVCTDKSLDNRGFLFDQIRIDQWFQSQRTTALSCEAYATYCARQLYKLIVGENRALDIASMELELSPEPYAASITFQWDQASPATAQVATVTPTPVRMRPSQGTLGLNYGLFN